MKTNREYKRRFPWFSASLGVIALASVATLFVSGQLNAGQGEFGLFVTRMVDRITTAQAGFNPEGSHAVTFADGGQSDGLVVSGFPSYASADLSLVRDQEPRAVRLVLRGEQDVSSEAVTALRVTVNGRRVMERVLSPGRRDFNWVFDLTEELAGEPDARVAFQLLGDLPENICHNDRSMGAVIAFAPESGLEIELDGPLTSVRDVLALTPRDVTIATAEGDAWFETAVRLGARLTRQGYRVTMVDMNEAAEMASPGLRGLFLVGAPESLQRAGFNPVRERAPAGAGLWRRAGSTMVAVMDAERIETVRFLTSELASIARSDSVDAVVFDQRSNNRGLASVERFGVDTSIQRIADSREWRFDYSLSQTPGGLLPEALAVDLRLPEGPEGFTNIAHVELNGEFIDSRRLQPGVENRYAVALPPERQAVSNEIAVVLQRHRDDGGCEISQQRYPVQLTADSGLVFARGAGAAGFTALPTAFAEGVMVRAPEGLSGPGRLIAARVAAEAVAQFVPVDAPLRFDFVMSENGESGPVDGPFLAVNTQPVNASAALRVYADRLVMDSRGGQGADVRALSDLALVQTGRARLNPGAPEDQARFASGLIVHAIDSAPSLAGARFGRDFVAIVHADGQSVTPATASLDGLDRALP
ncbi:MAG: hypothetical protein NXI12_07765 [Alphaproteobacteria bacterium]|nr:hypothetical protein [Alphaproteobacteria bacterium]